MIRAHIRIGHGHDTQRLAAGARFVPGGVAVEFARGPSGASVAT